MAALTEAVHHLTNTTPRVLVAIDGPDAAGKTTLADRVAAALGKQTVRASIDGFHRPRHERIARGELSPDGYYSDSFDYDALQTKLLHPFTEGAPRAATRVFDYRTDSAREELIDLPMEAALLFDGVFLLRPELRDHWHLSIYLDVAPDETLRRAMARDSETMAYVRRRYETRYLPGQQIYIKEAQPQDRADIVIDNNDPAVPIVRKWLTDADTGPATG